MPPEHSLLASAIDYARAVTGLAAATVRVEVRLVDRSRRIIELPVIAPPPPAPHEWPPAEGWALRPGEAAYCGRAFRLAGHLWGLLRALADRPGEPVSADRLKRAVWGEEPGQVDDNNLQGHVSMLRRRLREALGLDARANPVEHADGAYRLAVH